MYGRLPRAGPGDPAQLPRRGGGVQREGEAGGGRVGAADAAFGGRVVSALFLQGEALEVLFVGKIDKERDSIRYRLFGGSGGSELASYLARGRRGLGERGPGASERGAEA